MLEEVGPGWGVYIRSAREIERFRSPYQQVEVHDSVAFGKLFRLDGHFMTSERDEFYYHETLVHIAALAHPQPRHVLIVGGGDGGSAEEVLKHPSVQAVTLCEIDLAVVDIARKHLASVHRGVLDDPRVTLQIADGFAFVHAATGFYDLIVLDLTDPGGPSTTLYTAEFYRACAARLHPQGALTLHVGSPVAHASRIAECLGQLRQGFQVLTPMLVPIPLYGGLWMMAAASASLDPRSLSGLEVDRRIAQRGLRDLRYVNGDTYRGTLALPNFVRAMVGG
jgi:spermidine synthase